MLTSRMDVLLVLSTSHVFGMVQTVYGCQPTFQSKYDAYSFNGHHSSSTTDQALQTYRGLQVA